jgi:hypothetical protein
MAPNPPYPKAPVYMPGPSDIPHVSTMGEINDPDRGIPLQRAEAWVERVVRSVRSRVCGTAPTETDD